MKAKTIVTILVLTFSIAGCTAQPKPDPTQFSELEKTKLENLQLKQVLLNQQSQAFQSEVTTFGAEIEKEHPGYTLQNNLIVPKPKPASAVAAPKK